VETAKKAFNDALSDDLEATQLRHFERIEQVQTIAGGLFNALHERGNVSACSR
jgi:hypothetical protein